MLWLRLHDAAVALCGALHLRANNLLPPDLLFTVFKAAAFQPTQDAAATAAAAAASQKLLPKSGDFKDANNLGLPGPQLDTDSTPVTPPGAVTAPTNVAADDPNDSQSPLGPTRIGRDADGLVSTQQQQQKQPQRQHRQWQPLRPRAVPPLTDSERQFAFNPYSNPDAGGTQGVPSGALTDTRGLEAQVSANIVCSAPFKYVCLAILRDMHFSDLEFMVPGLVA